MEYFNQRMLAAWIAIISFTIADEVIMRFYEDEVLFKGPNVLVWAHLALMMNVLVFGVYAAFGPVRIRQFFRFVDSKINKLFG